MCVVEREVARMKWSERDIRPVDALAVIRANPRLYMGEPVVTAAGLSARVADDARILGCLPVEVEEHEDWCLVGAGADWCKFGRHAPADALDLFRRAWPFLEVGANSIRSEILVAAFACDVFTGSSDGVQVVQGAEPENSVRQRVAPRLSRRVIGFRMGSHLRSREPAP
jgi:hypothetical protein